METTLFIFAVILGLVIGSFLNVCIYRIPRDESIVFPPSHCTNCGYRLRWYDLIPVVSYIFLRGKCRSCGEKISMLYPSIELFTGIMFGFLYLKFGYSLEFFKYAVMICFLIVIGVIDYMTTDVYFSITVTGVIFGAIFIVLEKIYLNKPIIHAILGGLIAAGVIAAIVYLTKAMGEGDIEICFLSGLFLGYKYSFLMLLFSFIIGGIIGAILIILKIKDRKDYIPFGPFISLSTILVVFFGDKLLNWYLGLF
ncbi:prepilin peptidase [Thermobrachium celere]|uniref:prepilin peptidase n=1 Tax=Thermobrachium celere TaxID=53422 RepID=UPI00194383C2|nr:A24 family peptidase [Thermobrachium celere]GFR36406.1 prepilin peptidase [Thermobrachium celere]